MAERLGYVYIDSGAMYRAGALAAIRKGLSLDDENQYDQTDDRILSWCTQLVTELSEL